MIRSPSLCELLIALALLFCSPPALAQQDDGALARALFEDGRELMDDGNYGEACPKLAESYRLLEGGGTLLNLALCHEKLGKLATAWSQFKDARARALSDKKPERVTFADEHIEALTPRLSRLTVELAPGADVPELEIRHNGTPLSQAVVGTAFPVDGGRHVLVASAPGHERWQRTVVMANEGEEMSVIIPPLEEHGEDAPVPRQRTAPAPVEGDEAQDGAGLQRTIGYVVGGVGIASVIVGAIFGVRAITLRSESDDKCGDNPQCPRTPEGMSGLEANEDAQTSATVSNALIGAGLGLVGVGLVVVLTAPNSKAAGAHVTLTMRW